MGGDANPPRGKPLLTTVGEDRPGYQACRTSSRSAPSGIPVERLTSTDPGIPLKRRALEKEFLCLTNSPLPPHLGVVDGFLHVQLACAHSCPHVELQRFTLAQVHRTMPWCHDYAANVLAVDRMEQRLHVLAGVAT